jgi:hypothetical protein
VSVSSHLTPEPERRLWLILENMRLSAHEAEWRLGAVAVFCAAELAALRAWEASGPLVLSGAALLTLALLLAAAGFIPLSLVPKWQHPSTLDTSSDPNDCLIFFGDLAKYSHGSLIGRFDKYLGGGITGTPYYEDLVGQIVVNARIAARKSRVLLIASLCAAAGQLGLAAALLAR